MKRDEKHEILGMKLHFWEFDNKEKDIDIEIPKGYRFYGIDLERKKVIVSFKLKK